MSTKRKAATGCIICGTDAANQSNCPECGHPTFVWRPEQGRRTEPRLDELVQPTAYARRLVVGFTLLGDE